MGKIENRLIPNAPANPSGCKMNAPIGYGTFSIPKIHKIEIAIRNPENERIRANIYISKTFNNKLYKTKIISVDVRKINA
tara:strand:+ start:6335 stop:6574 length:240 start_codon:yes stop_codon:yes gene_type:complete